VGLGAKVIDGHIDNLPARAKILAWAGAAVLMTGLVSGCGTVGEVAAQATAAEASTCEDLIPDVVAISQEKAGIAPAILQVYEPKMISDKQSEYASGALKVPAGETRVVVLTCEGTAAWDDGDKTRLRFTLEFDLKNEAYVFYEPL
jgi:hypothetical protein